MPRASKSAGAKVPRVSVRAANPVDIEVGRRVRSRRVECGLSQTTLGDRLGITFQQVQKYESGANRIGAGRLQRIAEVLDVPVSFFFHEVDADGAESLFTYLRNERAIRMVKAFHRIGDPRTQQALVSLAERLAGNDE
jgi:transcriptional regulator with XRE-family HTH domain